MTDDIVTVLREHLKRPEMMHTTHWDGCMESHTICALAWSLDEIQRLREKVQDLRMYAEQDSCEIERLRAELALATKWRDNYKLAYEKATNRD